MIKIKQIMLPTDFSPPSEIALRYAKEFAETFSAKLHLLHVVEDALMYTMASPEGVMPMPIQGIEEAEEHTRQRLQKLVAKENLEHLDPQIVALSGSPFLEIVRYAKDQGIDLIIMGTHGRGPIAHMLMGSVAEKVVRKAPCPVLTVRHPEHEFVMP